MKIRTLSVACIGAALATSSPAAIVIDSITGASLGGSSMNITGPNTSISLFGSPIPFPDHQVAVRFRTGIYGSTLDQLDFAINFSDPNHFDPVQVVLSQGPNPPGGVSSIVLGTVSPSLTGGFSQELSIAPASTVSLDANTEYWLHFVTTGSQPFYSLASSNQTSATGNWAYTEVWTIQPPGNWNQANGVTPGLRILATEAVPEPSSSLIAGLGLLLACRRRR